MNGMGKSRGGRERIESQPKGLRGQDGGIGDETMGDSHLRFPSSSSSSSLVHHSAPDLGPPAHGQ